MPLENLTLIYYNNNNHILKIPATTRAIIIIS